MTSNNGNSGKAARNIDRALHTNGGILSAGFDLQMPGNCIESSDEKNKSRLLAAPASVDGIADMIRKRTVNFTSAGTSADKAFVTSSYFYGTKSLRRLTVLNSFKITNACTGCGICEKVCPVHNITIKENQAIHSDHCAACFACLHWCPVHATLPKFLPIRHRKQYTHPEIKLEDIIQSER